MKSESELDGILSQQYYTTKRSTADRFIYLISISMAKFILRFDIVYLLIAVLLACNCVEFCEVEDSEVKIFTTQNQIQQMPLDKYIRGFDLDFNSSDQTIVSVFEPYHVISKADVTIKAGYAVVNVDGKNSNTKVWSRQGVIFAQGGQRNVSFGYGEFSNGVLPKIEGYNYYELPYVSNCYSGLIYNENMDTVIDCEKTTSNPQELTDLVCLTFRSGKLSCKSFGSITKTSKRKSVILQLGSEQFLFSASLTDHISAKFENETFINIYRMSQDSVEFNLIVDRRTLGLNTLSITDIDVVEFEGVQYLILSDLLNGLIIFKYDPANYVDEIKVIPIEGLTRQFAESPEGTWLIATNKYVLNCGYDKTRSQLIMLKRYELDPTDNKVTDLQSSYLFVSVRTFLGHLYTFDRKYSDLKYLLNKEEITENTAVAVSPFYPRLFQINSTTMASIAISSGALFVSQVEKSTTVVVRGHSGETSCVFYLQIELIKDASTKIYQKKMMTSAYRLESEESLRFNLAEYFGGSNLKYDIKASDKIMWSKEHINQYSQNLPRDSLPEEQSLFTKVIQIDRKSYYLTVFTTVQAIFFKCSLENTKVSCKQIDERVKAQGKIFASADGLRRSNGNTYISWTYANSQEIFIKMFGSRSQGSYTIGQNRRFTQTLVGEKYFAYVQKQLGRLTFNQKIINDATFSTFSKSSFTQAQLASMGGGFYPREIFSSYNNPNVFYIKFPIAVVAISYTGGKDLQVLSYNKVSQTYISDDLWQIVVGRSSILLFTPDAIEELAILSDGNMQRLHKIYLNKKPIFPVKYQVSTDTAYFQCEDGTIQYVRLNQPALDSAYYALKLKNTNGKNDWDVSGSWLVSRSGQVYYQFQEPALVITSTLPDSSSREDLSVTITISSQNEKKDILAKVTSFNYPVKIEASSAEDNGLTLPEKGNNQTIPFPIDKYFTGSVANYKIVCPYCLDGTLKLVLPIQILKENADFNNYDAIVGLEDSTGAVVLKKNSLKIVDLTNTVTSQKSIEATGKCSSMGLNEGNLVVFCSNSANQELYLYQIKGNSVQFVKSYLIPSESIIFKPSQIGLYKRGNKISVFIHDVDLMNPVLKDSNIKVLELSEVIEYKGKLDSSAFQIANSDPINSMSIKKDRMLVAIGGKGLGYLNLANSKTAGSFVNLETQPALKEFTLDDTAYLRVSIYSDSGEILSALVTTSNTYSYLIEFKVGADGKIQFSRLLETYRRYGHQRCLNWGLIDDNFVMLSFYNQTTSTQTLALYRRNSATLTDFYSSIQFIIPSAGLRPPKAALLHSSGFSYLFMDNSDKPSASGSLNLYNITHEFGLLATYEKPSSFEIINVTASNDYYSVNRELSVSFDGQPSGVKWYSIVIVVCLVAIAIGVAFGFYLRMKRKKADSKKVSLFTENEDIDEQV